MLKSKKCDSIQEVKAAKACNGTTAPAQQEYGLEILAFFTAVPASIFRHLVPTKKRKTQNSYLQQIFRILAQIGWENIPQIQLALLDFQVI